MTPHDFDRLDKLIDTAAQEMVSGEPARSFTSDVMSRVRGRVEPARQRSVFAIGAIGAAALGAPILIVILNRAPVPVTVPPAQRTEVPQTRVIEQITPSPGSEPVAPRQAIRRAARRAVSPPPVNPGGDAPVMTSVEPLATEPIVLSALDVPSLENLTTIIEDIEIEDITIEPLVASND